ncbi:hypothetical protein GLAREA_03737 [Glarea lozoyensis ATCC 20868]|uniref:gamma-glutamylcyclotransferase n=1 Tax=Glarea lozoyensis (strain ATCC 20868 / MF5171) TaxID=1116229 RepID=S3CYX3_GLAL2|nr:uncharacterized protein GLAREA_03737 [Glarea lozoyensis ATCC 20868]EPE30770.1 hypothetical protein GLAREA_03737 [Glarea lozoyensis ATCC 20868]
MTELHGKKPLSVELDSNLWYFAYGSNLNKAVFAGRRGIKPKDSETAILPDYELCFNVLFMPYTEPAMAGLRKRVGSILPVHGVNYLLSREDFRKIVLSEGSGVAYKVIEVVAVNLSGGKPRRVYTLITRRDLPFAIRRFPSKDIL